MIENKKIEDKDIVFQGSSKREEDGRKFNLDWKIIETNDKFTYRLVLNDYKCDEFIDRYDSLSSIYLTLQNRLGLNGWENVIKGNDAFSRRKKKVVLWFGRIFQKERLHQNYRTCNEGSSI